MKKVHTIVPAKWNYNPSAQSGHQPILLPKGSHQPTHRQLSAYPLGGSVMSSMVSPGVWVARWGPPRATHPTEVVTVSM